jgi:hypothetical protein
MADADMRFILDEEDELEDELDDMLLDEHSIQAFQSAVS